MKGVKSCECIEELEKQGWEFDYQQMGETKGNSITFWQQVAFPVHKGKKKELQPMQNCPFCGRPLHEITPETWAERLKEEKEKRGDKS